MTISSAIAIVVLNSQTANRSEQGSLTFSAAESGIENALLRLLRNPNYTGETVPIGNATVVIVVSGTNTKTIIAEGKIGKFSRKVQVIAQYSNNVFEIQSWKELF